MIAIIGTKTTNELIENLIGFRRKDFDIEYYSYTNLNQIKDITQNENIEGILFSGFIGLKAYENIENRINVPYDMITADMISFVMYVLEIVLKYKHIDLNEIYFDYIELLKKYSPDMYNLFPSEFVNAVQTYKFIDLEDFTRENIYSDIKSKYDNGEIKVAVVTAAKISNELEELGILYHTDTIVSEEDLFSSYNRLVKDVIQHKQNTLKFCTCVLETSIEKQEEIVSALGLTHVVKTKDKNILIFKLKAEEIIISHDEVYIKKLMKFSKYKKSRIGIGLGRTDIESNHNAFKALKYSKIYNSSNGFLLTEERAIYGPINNDKCLKINEYQLESCYDYSRSIGIKNFNYCRLLALYDKKKLLSTEEVSIFLNIAHRSSNRILTILEEKGIIEQRKLVRENKVGRPMKKYRLIR